MDAQITESVTVYPEDVFDIELKLLLDAIYLTYSYDFRNYSQTSLRRRLHHALQRFECATLSELQAKVVHQPRFFVELLQYLTVSVTEMFRDPAYFLALRRHVVPVLRTYPSLKIWIAGCSTGQEAYSMAILLHEEKLLERTIIYATDINPKVLEKARRGIFPLDSIKTYTENYQQAGGTATLADYYTAAYDSVLFDKMLQENITFADHSLATDSVFSEMQLISCRNVLIYFDRELQNRALGLFRDSLCRRGFLGLGTKETVEFTACAQQFEALVEPARIFRKT